MPAFSLPPAADRKALDPAQEIHPEQACRITRTFGTQSEKLTLLLVNQVLGALPAGEGETHAELLARVWPAIEGLAPQDEIEGMLAVQMVAVHNVALDQLHRAAHAHHYEVSGPAAADKAAKLLRIFREQLQALQRYRGQGQQKVTVEHVHVHPGGQLSALAEQLSNYPPLSTRRGGIFRKCCAGRHRRLTARRLRPEPSSVLMSWRTRASDEIVARAAASTCRNARYGGIMI